MFEYQANFFAAKRLKEQYNSMVDKMEDLNKQYKNEPDDKKAAEILETYNRYRKRSVTTMNQYNKFKDKRISLEEKAVQADDLINKKIAEKENNKDLTVQKRH